MKDSTDTIKPIAYARLTRLLAIVCLWIAWVHTSAAHASSEKAIVFPGKAWKHASPESQGIDPNRLQIALKHLRDVCGAHGTDKVVIVRNGYVIWQGPHVEQPYITWSCTKSFLSTCFGLLWDEGLCTPQTLAADIEPKLREHYPTVTLGHMLTFTSGYCYGKNRFDPIEPAFAAGTAFHYSNEGQMLALILTRIAGQSLESLFFERIGEPIGITRKAMDWGEITHRDGMAINGGRGFPGMGVSINALAMARFGWLMCNDGVWDGKRLLSQRYLNYATAPRVPEDMPAFDKNAWYIDLPGNYGLSWWTNGPMPDGQRRWPHAPERTFAAQGLYNNVCFIIPQWQMVIVRLGHDKVIDMAHYDRVFELLDPNAQQPAK